MLPTAAVHLSFFIVIEN